MKRILLIELVIIGLVIFIFLGCATEPRYFQNPDADNVIIREPLRPPAADVPAHTLPKFRVVSLKRLQEAVREGHGKGVSPNSVQNMCGLNTIEGFLLDRKNKDLLIFGKVADLMPPLLLEDFIVAFRSACKKYVVDDKFTPPECSIDPSDKTLSRIVGIEKRIMNEASPSKWKSQKKAYEKACAERHKVKVSGIPSQTHFASVLVKADYDMKRIVNGTDVVYIPGVVDLYSLKSYEARRAMKAQKPIRESTASLNRFWLKPAQFHFVEQQDMVILDKFEVAVMTEEQYVTENKYLKGKGKSDPEAERVAQSITTYYTYIAQKRRVFRQLKELMRMYIVFEAMHNKDAHNEFGLNFDYLLSAYRVPKHPVSSSLPGLSRYVTEHYERETYETTQQSTFVFPMCGGVSFDVFFRWEDFAMVVDQKLTQTYRDIIRQKPNAKALYWDVIRDWRLRRKLPKS